MPEGSLATQISWFADHGIPVLPLVGKTGDIKKASITDKVTGNYGVALGNGLIGIDYDEYDGALTPITAFPETRMWRSGSNQGYGLLYKVPLELSNHGMKVLPGITIRACGSYLVGPGSIHPGTPEKNIPKGGIYTLVNDTDIADAPEEILDLLRGRATRATEAVGIGIATKPDWLFNDNAWVKKFEIVEASDRSGSTWDIAVYSGERGASNEELSWIMQNFKPAIDKGNLSKEIPRIVQKVRDKHPHADLACDEVQCENTPAWMTEKKQLEVFDFWTQRQEFKDIKQAAEARMVSPKAVLMSVLCHIAASIPVEITLPAIIGKRASLNFFVCFVGKSGAGKGASTGVAGELYDYSKTGYKHKTTTPASGEGVVSTYIRYDADAKAEIQKETNALLNFDEIDNLRATTDRQGSTLSAMLRQGFSGELIGYQLSKRNTELHPHSYRMALQLSAQPAKSDWLLEDGDGGLPQRFVFVTTSNPERPGVDALPEFPTVNEWRVPNAITDIKKKKDEANKPNPIMGKLDVEVILGKQFIDIPVCYKAIKAIRQARQDSLDEVENDLDGHALLVRLKVAALLGILNGRLEVSDEDWDLSAIIMVWSNQARNKIKSTIADKNIKLQMARTTARVSQETVVDNAKRNNDLERVAKRTITLIERGIVAVRGRGNIRMKLARDSHLTEEVIEYLVTQKKVTYDEQEDVVTLVK